MTRKECKCILKQYKWYKCKLENINIDMEYVELENVEKINLYKQELVEIDYKIKAIEEAIKVLDDKSRFVIDTYIACNGRTYVDVLKSNLGVSHTAIYTIINRAISKMIPLLEPVFI